MKPLLVSVEAANIMVGMATDTGVNLLAPGKTPKTNLMFLLSLSILSKRYTIFSMCCVHLLHLPATITGWVPAKHLGNNLGIYRRISIKGFI